MEVLNALIKADPDHPCSIKAREIVADDMKFSSTLIVSNYIGRLKEKGAVLKTATGYTFNPILIPSGEQNSIEIVWESQQNSPISH